MRRVPALDLTGVGGWTVAQPLRWGQPGSREDDEEEEEDSDDGGMAAAAAAATSARWVRILQPCSISPAFAVAAATPGVSSH